MSRIRLSRCWLSRRESRVINVRTRKQFQVVCEVKDCGRKAPWASSSEKAVKKAKKNNWKSRKGRWMCPRCANRERYGHTIEFVKKGAQA